jgi:gluconate 2-dehydrogenase alpha chain
MSTIMHPATDVVVLGCGQASGPVAAELTKEGYSVVGIEKGRYWNYATDWTPYEVHDEWQLMIERKFDHPLYLSTFSMRAFPNQFALPKRRYSKGGDGVLGHAVGGAATHYGANASRYGPWTFAIPSNLTSRYGPNAVAEMTPALWDGEDWPITYDQADPYYTAYEKSMGMSGTTQAPFSPFTVPGYTSYPTGPHPMTALATLFQSTTESMGYHPVAGPNFIVSEPYTNQYGIARNACVYCGYCSGTACNNQCEVGAKSSSHVATFPAAIATGKFTMVQQAYVFRINLNAAGTQATGVSYYDQNGNVNVQPATVVFNGMWGLNIVRSQLLSGIGNPYNGVTYTGSVGRAGAFGNGGSTTSSQSGTVAIGANAYSAGNAKGDWLIEDFKNDNFDHTGMPFYSGAVTAAGAYTGNGSSLISQTNAAKQTLTPAFIAGLKNFKLPTKLNVTTGINAIRAPTKDTVWDLDPHYNDIYGDPIGRITANWFSNPQTWTAAPYLAPLTAPILTKMGATNVTFNQVPVGSATSQGPMEWGHHWRRGNPIGLNPATSTGNLWTQSWTVPNYFISGEAAQTIGDESGSGTHQVGMMAYLSADGIKQYLAGSGGLLTTTPS